MALVLPLAAVFAVLGEPQSASATPGTPGIPQAPVLLYHEDFQNGTGVTDLQNYVSAEAPGIKYSASPYWLNVLECNGFVLEYTDPRPAGYCDVGTGPNYNYTAVQDKVYALGLLNSPQNPTANRAISTNTSNVSGTGTITPNQIEFQTDPSTPLNLPSASGRFITFSVDAAATFCGPGEPPLLRFYLRDSGGVEHAVSSSAINPCTDPRGLEVDVDGEPVNYGHFPANGSMLLSSSTFGIVMRNESDQAGSGNDGAIDNIQVLDVTPQLDKSFSPTLLHTGQNSTLTFTVTNTDELAAKSGWGFTDNLPAGLKLASSTVGGTCSATTSAVSGGSTITVTNGTLSAGQQSCTVTVQVTSSTAGTYTNTPANVTVTALNPPGSASVTFADPGYFVEKTVDKATAVPGEKVTYTVTVRNLSDAPYTAGDPASFTDTLTDVLDDATYNGDASNGATVSGNTLSWSGPLAVGGSATITYSVTVKNPDPGDHIMTNSYVPGPGGVCTSSRETCTTTTLVQSYTVAKSVDTTTANPGQKVTYTVTVTNTGQVDYTAGSPASFADDLSAVLDDATYNFDATGGATLSGTTLSWSGALAVGATVTVTYSVTVDNPDLGNKSLTNTVVANAPGGGCAAVGRCTTTTPSGTYTVTKSADKSTASPGDTVTYTVTVENTGQVAYTALMPASFTDDLTAVLDDADYNGDATGGATVSGNTLTWSGSLGIGATATITYSVTIKDPDTGNHTLTNAVVPTGQGGECPTAAQCTTTTNVQSYSVSKSASAATAQPGDTITYSVTVKNTGQVAYTAGAPASFTDDLSDVLDDADYNGDASGGATVTAGTLTWSGALAVGATLTITYSVTVKDPDTGDGHLINAVVPTGPNGDCTTSAACTTDTPVQMYTVAKTASATSANPGDTVTYAVTVENTGQVAYTAGSPASFTDDLTDVLDDAVYNGDATGGATVSGNTLTWSGALGVGATATITYSVTVKDPDSGDKHLVNAVVATGGGGACAAAPAVCTTDTPVQSYTVAKSVDSTTANPGQTITYTVTVRNTGEAAYTAGDPASFTDDLSAVLDDATYNGDATGGATVSGNTLSWSGALAVGGTVTITYSVTVDDPDNGDKHLTNVVVSTGPGGGCATPGGCTTTTPSGSYTVSKSASAATANPGQTVTYTVTVTNTGEIAYTAGAPASFTDDLTGVLDDAVYNGDATGGATVSGSTLTWSGPLAIGGTVTITYSATVKNPDTGDHSLVNAIVPTGPGGGCETAGDCTTTTPIRSFTVSKTASAASANPGDTITYTVTVTNTGQVAYTAGSPASFTDDLSDVLDDAVYNGDATGGATVSGSTLTWSGALGIGAFATVTYSVTVKDPDTSGDHELVNAVVPRGPDGGCAPAAVCTTTTPVQSYTVSKRTDVATANPGDTVTYTVTVVNTGQVAYAGSDLASFTDDLSDVLDDATIGALPPGTSLSGTTLTWSGPLAVGATVTVSYTATVHDPDTGDMHLVNAVVPTGGGGGCVSTAVCTTDTPVRGFTVAKHVDATTVHPGQKVTYTVTVTNTGQVAYTAEDPASFTDDLSDVLDDATYDGDATGGATVTGTTLSWSGAVAVGASATITYSVTVRFPDTGNKQLINIVTPTGGGGCTAADPCSTDNPVQSYTVAKAVDSTEVNPGQKITYTVTISNTGEVDYTAGSPASFRDDLSRVLDDATYNGDATGGATVSAEVLTWSGPLAIGQTITVTYSVTVNDPDLGDRRLTNVVVPTAPGGDCAQDGACTTAIPEASFTVAKAASATTAHPGDTVTYRVTVTNTGKFGYNPLLPASFTDDLSKVLDDATYNGDASAGATVSGRILSWSGSLDVGETITVTYSVTVNNPDTGDGSLVNAVLPTAEGGECTATADCSVTTSVETAGLPPTGGAAGPLIVLASLAGLLVAAGVALTAANRRTRRHRL